MATLSEIVEAVAKRLEYPKDEAWSIVDETMKEVQLRLQAGEEVKIRALGNFAWADRKERQYKHPSTKELMTAPGGKALVFKAAGALRGVRSGQVRSPDGQADK